MRQNRSMTKMLPILLILLSAFCTKLQSHARQPNIILILADDLGYGDLSCFGQRELKTPRLDAMSKQGMKLTQFYSGSTVCAPSRSVLMTGQHTGHTPVRGNSTNPIIIPPGYPTIASVLKSAGYKTGCIGKWGIGTPDNHTNPNDVGFDHFFGYIDMWHAHNFYPEFLIRNGTVVRLKNEAAEKWKSEQDPSKPRGGRGVAAKKVEYAPDLFADDVLGFIREHQADPFFLYFAMNVPHANNEAGKEGMEVPELGEFANKPWPEPEKGFAAMIQNIDRDTGRILDLLHELKIADDTLVIFTSDNGPHNEGGHRADHFDSNGRYRGIKRDLYEGGIRVPTIAWWPGTIKPGSENADAWYFGDVMATVAEIADTEAPEKIDSQSFAATLAGKPPAAPWSRNQHLYWEFYEGRSAQAVRFGKWKAVRIPMFTGPVELYDLSKDQEEENNLADAHPELVEWSLKMMQRNHTPDPNWQPRGAKKNK